MGREELQRYQGAASLSNTSANGWILHCSWAELYSPTEAPPASLSLGQNELQA